MRCSRTEILGAVFGGPILTTVASLSQITSVVATAFVLIFGPFAIRATCEKH